MKRIFSSILPSASVLAMLMAAPAMAQDGPDEVESSDEEIVVTGTSIRGVAPAGGQTIGLDSEDVVATGATSAVQLLSSVPQLSEFNGLPTILSSQSASQQAANRPAVRGLNSGASGGSPTLILMDGHRLPGAGVIQTVTDPDIVPPGVIQRVEVVTDGGSSVYGADAVGGVINFITRKEFDGVEFTARQGFGDEYQSTDGSITAGTSWTGGSGYVSYNYAQHDEIYGRDRDYVRRITYDPASPLVGLPIGRSCNQGNVSVGGDDYNIDTSGPGVSFTPGTLESVRCDLTDDATIYPQERRDSWFGGFNQDLSENLTFDLRAWYTDRVTKNDRGPNFDSGVDNAAEITPANNNFYRNIPGHAGEEQTVYYNFASVPGLDTTVRVELETWGFSPSLTYDIGNDWQARGFLNYGHSVTKTKDPGINSVALEDNFENVNFYDIASTPSDVLRAIFTDNTDYAYGDDQIVNGRLVLDGPLFTLPGGEVRAAFGAEYLGEQYESMQGTNLSDESRRARALFAELSIPLVSAENNIPLVHSLDLSLSARHDMYSDFGEVTNPRIGITYEPFDWLRLRGNWGESFQAPSLADTAQTGTTVGATTPTSVLAFALPFAPIPGDRLMVVGGAADLAAQTAETYSVGFDLRPPMIENLEISGTYYNIEFTGMISSPPVFLESFYTSPGTAQFFQLNESNPGAQVSNEDLIAWLQSREVDQADIDEVMAAVAANPDPVTLAVDFRRRNLGSVKLSGIDASARYSLPTDFGSLYFNASGTYQINNQIDADGLGYAPNAAGNVIGQPRWSGSATVGATIGDNFRGQATLLHSAEQGIEPLQAANFQEEIDAYDVVNLYFQYDLEGEGLRNNASLSLGVNNVFDNDPSSLNGGTFNTQGYVGGNLGRIVQIGLSKRF